MAAAQDAKGLDKNTLVAVLQFLNKNSLQASKILYTVGSQIAQLAEYLSHNLGIVGSNLAIA